MRAKEVVYVMRFLGVQSPSLISDKMLNSTKKKEINQNSKQQLPNFFEIAV